MDEWIVLQAETDQTGNGWLWMASTTFSGENGLEEAKAFLEHVVRDEWGTEVPVEGRLEKLADHRGLVCPGVYVKHSDVYYSEDGMEAWDTEDSGAGYARKVCIVKATEKGVRVCSNS